MASLLERLFPNVGKQLVESQKLVSEQSQRLYTADLEQERMQESMRELVTFMDDLGWDKIDGWETETGFPLDTIKTTADQLQSLLAVNPTIKKAISARVGYIWSRGMTVKGSTIGPVLNDAHNQTILFDPAATWALEAQLATDGNAWYMKGKNSPTITAVPIAQICGWVVDPNDPTRVTYWLRKYTITTTNFKTGGTNTIYYEKYIPAADNTNATATQIDTIPVDRTQVMHHIAANRQRTWVLGVPDIMAAMFWAKGFKELYESGATYVKAQGKFAAKVVAKSAVGAGKAAATIAGQPRRDEQTGAVYDNGGTAIMSGGLDYQLMGKMSGGVDFKAFDPVAGLIAVGLGVPLGVLLGTADTGETSLEESVVNEMRGRQALWTRLFTGLFSPKKVTIVWPKIKQEPTYRQIQSIEIANKTVSLNREELRQLTLEAFGLDGDAADVPDIEENAAYLMAKLLADNAAENAQDLAQQNADTAKEIAATTPEQGVDAGIGKLSDGVDAKDSRDNKSDTNTKNR
jgi:hypothetical protein